MRTYNRVYDWNGNILEETSEEHAGPVTLMIGGDGGGGTTSVSKQKPWEGVRGHLGLLYDRAGRYAATPQKFFPGQTFAGLSPLQEEGMYGGLDYMKGPYADQARDYLGGLQTMLAAPGNITQDPAVQAMIAANEASVTDALQGEWLPGVRRASQAAGDYGGSKTDILRGQAMGDAAEALARANAETLMGAYGEAGKQAAYAAQAMPGAMQLGMAPYQTAERVGGVERALDQQAIDEAMARHYFPAQDELARIQALNNALQGGMQFGTTKVAGGQTGGASPMAGALGGGLLGYGLSQAGIPALAGVGAWPLALGGAALGGIFS